MLAQLGILIAVMLLFHSTGIGYIKVGAIEMTIMLVPVIIGAIVLGPTAGMVLGGVFGITLILLPSTQAFFMSMNLPGTIILCVLIRGMGLGFLSGLIFKGLKKIDKSNVWSYETTGLITALLNTFLFIAGAALIFGNHPTMHEFFKDMGMSATTPGAIFLALFIVVGVQAIIEAALCTLIAAIIAKTIMTYLHKA